MPPPHYPRRKVFFAFLLCPFFAGLALVPFILISVMVAVFSKPKLIGEVRAGELFSLFLVMPLLAQLLFLIPAFVIGLWISMRKVEGCRRNYLTIALAGAGVALGWSLAMLLIISSGREEGGVVEQMLSLLPGFVMSAVTLGLTAFWFLPKRLSGEAVNQGR
ncbi:hypothetical protein [Pseudomonas cremoricolorata]|uniref:Uncharacterized protein n=1 Tax=Pseudomonas cremoricolorata TaxID=157783 RepID=A0A089WJQ6_9PSED|nr:hypothetical protein [Pseudomonas cremoricolorata]AIR88836.1 hypothetical protein LK03_05940 [Pseudomonas cremoricolorata]